MTLLRDGVFAEVMNLNEVIGVGPNPVKTDNIIKGEIWTQKQPCIEERQYKETGRSWPPGSQGERP